MFQLAYFQMVGAGKARNQDALFDGTAVRQVRLHKTRVSEADDAVRLAKKSADENGWVKGMKVVKMELGEPDESGRRRPVEIPGSEYVIDCNTVIMSLGTSPNPLIKNTTAGLETNKRGCITATEDTGKTSRPGVFAGGDAVTGAATVILAMEAGRAGARGIHEYLTENN